MFLFAAVAARTCMVDRHILDTMCQGWRLDVKAVHTDCTSLLLLLHRFFAHMFGKPLIGSLRCRESSGKHWRSYRIACKCLVVRWLFGFGRHISGSVLFAFLWFFSGDEFLPVKSRSIFWCAIFFQCHIWHTPFEHLLHKWDRTRKGRLGKILQNAHGSVCFSFVGRPGEPSLSTHCLHKRSMPSDKITNHSSGSHLVTNSRNGNNLSGRDPFGLQPRQYNIMSGLRFFLGASLENFFLRLAKWCLHDEMQAKFPAQWDRRWWIGLVKTAGWCKCLHSVWPVKCTCSRWVGLLGKVWHPTHQDPVCKLEALRPWTNGLCRKNRMQ